MMALFTKNYDIANAILNRLPEEWEIEEVDIYD